MICLTSLCFETDNWHCRLKWFTSFPNFIKVNYAYNFSEHRKTCNCNSYSLMSPPFWLQSLKGQGIRGFLEKTCRKDYNGNEPGRGENNSVPCEELLKEIRAHLSRKATKYRSSIILIWALISGDLMSRTMSGKDHQRIVMLEEMLVIQ